MDLLPDADFLTIVTVVVAAVGLHFTAKADRRRRQQEAEQRREAGEKRLADAIAGVRQEMSEQIAGVRQEIASVRQELGQRIDRLEDRVAENTASIAELKAEVRALSTKLDERSHPLRLEGGEQPSIGQGLASSAGVREEAPAYSSGAPQRRSESESGGELPSQE